MPTSEVKPALVRDPGTDERGPSAIADPDDAQMQVDPTEPAGDLQVPPNSQPASPSITTAQDEEKDTQEDMKPPPPPPPSTRPRVRVRRVSPRTLNELTSSNELLYVMLCAIEAHRQLYERAGVLHGDINPNTILILDWPASASASEDGSSSATCALGLLSGAAPATHSTSNSQASGSASPSQPPTSVSPSLANVPEDPDDTDGERDVDGEGEGKGYTEGALVDFDVPYSAAAWRHPRPGPFKWENHSALRMRRYGFY